MRLTIRKLLSATLVTVSPLLVLLCLLYIRHDNNIQNSRHDPLVTHTDERLHNVSNRQANIGWVGRERKRIIHLYLRQHNHRCTELWRYVIMDSEKPLCDCIPKTLLGHRYFEPRYAPLDETLAENPSVQSGGHWKPENCTARYRVAIIVPCRGRDEHLAILIKYLHPILQGQQLEYSIIVVDQHTPGVFNKAALMNVGYVYASEAWRPHCVIFHDVDMIPEDGRHFYACRKNPLHLGAYNTGHNYIIQYKHIFGAVTAFRSENFKMINGFSNRFSGWGGEDDEMSFRIRKDFNQSIDRDPKAVAGYTTLKHKRFVGTRYNHAASYMAEHRDSQHDGLNSLRFVLEKVEKRPLYTYIYVRI